MIRFIYSVKKEINDLLHEDHNYYHNSLVNQSFHFLSGLIFIITALVYLISGQINIVYLFPIFLLSWCIRQTGHFFFESKGYDHRNKMSFQEKEDVKTGMNLFRKLVMIIALIGLFFSSLFFPKCVAYLGQLLHINIQSPLEGAYALGFIVFIVAWVCRALWLAIYRKKITGLAWFLKILYDPINDIVLYHKAPIKIINKSFKSSLPS